jgi:glucosamine-6-phosphate deaminase
LEVIVHPTPETSSSLAAAIVARLIQEKPTAVLGLCTGNTPLHLYRELIRLHRENGLDFSRISTFNLDEYIGLSPDDPASYHSFMQRHLFSHINVPPSQIHIPDGLAKDVAASCAQYEESISRAGGIDLQLLGIGVDGHIGFNEPSSSLSSRTRIKTLTERTRQSNARSFGHVDRVPRHVVTMGLGTILGAGSCLLLAFGNEKAGAVAEMVEGPVTASLPASVLQLHRHVQVVLDEAAASKLAGIDYYRDVYAGKPEWQRP